ncbi:protein YgfX [Sulfuricella sp. T08]|uniref:protein YgfX n=1 Tax=Sulfuricella sp. T08 TaxID=1632857 RepID=UPI000AE62746
METLTITVGPSRRLAGLLVGMHGFSAAMFWLAPLPQWIVVLLMPVFLGSAWHTLRRDSFRTLQNSLVALRLDTDCSCEFQTRAGAWHEADLLGSSFVAPYLTVLNLKPESGRLVKHLVILPDAIHAEDFRRLRVWLKWRCKKVD